MRFDCKVFVAFFVIISVLLLNSCAQMGANVPGFSKKSSPVKQINMDYTFLDMMTAMLRVNHIMLNRMQVSADAEWVGKLKYPEEGTNIEEYEKYLNKQMQKDFIYFKQYSDFQITDLASLGKMKDRALTETMEKLALRIEHQKGVINKVPFGCSAPNPWEEKSQPSASECKKLKQTCQDDCPFFSKSLEEQLYNYMVQQETKKWIQTPIDQNCLRKTVATKHKLYSNFNQAFFSLLPENLGQKIKSNEEDLDRVNKRLSSLESKIEQSENCESDDQKCTKLSTNQVKALEKKITNLEQKLESLKDVNAKLYEQAKASPQANEGDIALAKRLKGIAETVNQNLTTAEVGTPALLGKIGMDFRKFAQAATNPAKLAKSMTYETTVEGGTTEPEGAAKQMTKRASHMMKRTTTLLPNTFYIAKEISLQEHFISQKSEYLSKIIQLGES